MSSLLQLLPYFEAVARPGNFTRAASQLGVTPPAVSQNIQALENQLGVRLFHRTSRSVRLSDEGRLFYQKVSPAMSQIDVAADDVRATGRTPGGPAAHHAAAAGRLAAGNAAPGGISTALSRRAAGTVYRRPLFRSGAGQFRCRHSHARHAAKDMIAVPIDNGQRRVLVASPDYLARCGVPATPDDLPAHHCLRYRFPAAANWNPGILAWRR